MIGLSISAIIMIAVLFVLGGWLLAKADREAVEVYDLRALENQRVRDIHAQAGNTRYPHELASGEVMWYRVDHDAMDV